MRNNLWSDEHTQMLVTMMGAGLGFDDVARAVGRNRHSVKERWRWINRSEEIKQARRDRMNASRRKPKAGTVRQAVLPSTRIVMDDDRFAERERRLGTPRTLSAELMGDPRPGYSALDRKRQEARR